MLQKPLCREAGKRLWQRLRGLGLEKGCWRRELYKLFSLVWAVDIDCCIEKARQRRVGMASWLS